MPEKGEAFWQTGRSQGRFASKWICLPAFTVSSCESLCELVGFGVCSLSVWVHIPEDPEVNRQTGRCICWYLVNHSDTLNLLSTLSSQTKFRSSKKPKHIFSVGTSPAFSPFFCISRSSSSPSVFLIAETLCWQSQKTTYDKLVRGP